MSVPKKAANHGRAAKPLHFITPTAELEVMKKSTPGVNLVHRQGLTRFESEMTRKLRKGFTQFLSPQLQVLVKEKPRIMLAEKADFGELLNEELSGRPIQELSVDLLRKSFTTRRRVGAPPPMDDAEAVPGRAPVPSDVPVEDQTTNKLSSAYMKKVSRCLSVHVEMILDSVAVRAAHHGPFRFREAVSFGNRALNQGNVVIQLHDCNKEDWW